jgi:pimeloyl-ACP methyl ester carboxylesterase
VQLPHGRALVDAIPGAQLVIQEGVAHAIPEEEWDDLATAILKHTAA